MKNLNLWLARKLLVSKKEIGLISFSGLVSIAGVAIGCLALIISVAVLNGFEKEIRKKIIGFEADLRLEVPAPGGDRGELENLLLQTPEISAYSFFLERKGVALTRNNKSLIWVKAVEDANLRNVYHIESSQVSSGESRLPPAYVGRGVADRLQIQAGDSLRLFNPTDSQVYLGFLPTVNVFVASIFETNVLNFDEKYCFIPLDVGQKLFREGTSFDGVDVRLTDNSATDAVAASLAPQLPDRAKLSVWRDLHKTLFSAMSMEKYGGTIVLSLIILVASFNIASTLLMLVMEKVREVGILRTLGASRNRIRRVFSFQGLFIGGVGLATGLGVGLTLLFVQRKWGIITLPENIYFTRSLPAVLSWVDLLLIVAIGLLLVGLCVIYPAKVAGRLAPMEAIRYEK